MRIIGKLRKLDFVMFFIMITAIILTNAYVMKASKYSNNTVTMDAFDNMEIKSRISNLNVHENSSYILEIRDNSLLKYDVYVNEKCIYSHAKVSNSSFQSISIVPIKSEASSNIKLEVKGDFPYKLSFYTMEYYNIVSLPIKISIRILLIAFLLYMFFNQILLTRMNSSKTKNYFIVIIFLSLLQTIYMNYNYLPHNIIINTFFDQLSNAIGGYNVFSIFISCNILIARLLTILLFVNYFDIPYVPKKEYLLLVIAVIGGIISIFAFPPRFFGPPNIGQILFIFINIFIARCSLFLLVDNYKSKSGGLFVMIGFIAFTFIGFLESLKLEYAYPIGLIFFVMCLSFSLAETYKQAVFDANIDQLTGLNNKKYFEYIGNKIFSEASRFKFSFSIAMIDIDFFKNFNDTYGHDIGDLVLKTLAKTIRDTVRSSDISCRFGGEEFVILFPQTDFEKTKMVAERIRKNIEKMEVYTEKYGALKCTVSIGLCSNLDSKSFPEMFKIADTELYNAKNNGRNIVCPCLKES